MPAGKVETDNLELVIAQRQTGVDPLVQLFFAKISFGVTRQDAGNLRVIDRAICGGLLWSARTSLADLVN
jgi:hypothetical protein